MGSKSAMPAARLGDIDTGHPPSPPTPIIQGSTNVLINFRPAARKGDMLVPHHPGIRKITSGSSSVLINGKPAARMLDGVNCGGKIIIGSGNVLIGDNPKTGGGGSVTNNIKLEQEFEEFMESSFKPANQSLNLYQRTQLAADIAVKYRGTSGAVATWCEYYESELPSAVPQTPEEAEGIKVAAQKLRDEHAEQVQEEQDQLAQETQQHIDALGERLAQAAAELVDGEMVTPGMIELAEGALAAIGYNANSDSIQTPPTANKVHSVASRRGVAPASLDDAAARLLSMGGQIAQNGHIPKYSDEELLAQAQAGDVASERFHVRFMKQSHQWDRHDKVKGNDNLTGMLGLPLQGKTGNGAKYWSTTFDQIEDADTNAELLCGVLGLDYDSNADYLMVIIDTHTAAQVTGVASVAATFDKVSEFSNRELPDEFPKEFTDITMNSEFQKRYYEVLTAGGDAGEFKNKNNPKEDEFKQYLSKTDISSNESKLLMRRFKMQKIVGNNQYYEGNGLTKNTLPDSDKNYGVVETLNFERKKTDLQKLKESGAIKLMSIG